MVNSNQIYDPNIILFKVSKESNIQIPNVSSSKGMTVIRLCLTFRLFLTDRYSDPTTGFLIYMFMVKVCECFCEPFFTST